MSVLGYHQLITVLAADFLTPEVSSTFFFFSFSLADLAENKQKIKFTRWCLKVYCPYSNC
jgi:hypothetical protein